MAIAGSQGEGEGVEGVKRRQPREGRRVVGSQAQEGFKHLIHHGDTEYTEMHGETRCLCEISVPSVVVRKNRKVQKRP